MSAPVNGNGENALVSAPSIAADTPEIPWRVSEAIESWRRIMDATQGDKLCNFERAAGELLALAHKHADDPVVRQVIVVDLHDMATLAGIDADTAQAAMAARVNGVFVALDQEPASPEPAGLGEYDFGEDTTLPTPREWLLGTTFCRTFLSSLIAAGGTGKTSVRYLQFLSLVTGRNLSGEHVHKRSRVLVISLEDDIKELKRRFLAVMKYYGVSHDDVKGWLFTAAPGRSAGKILETDKSGRRIIEGQLRENIEAAIIRRKPELVSIDPFVKSHAIGENDNTLIDMVAQVLTDLAAKYNIGIDAPHHVAKGDADPGNADKGRGASSLKDAARLVKTLTAMSVEEAKAFGIDPENRCDYLRVDNGKVNLVRRGGAAQWFKLHGQPLDNGTDDYPNGDTIQVAVPWTPPETWADMPDVLLNKILDKIAAGLPKGERYSDHNRAGDRAAWMAITSMAPHKSEGQAKEIIKAWVKNGVLVADEYESPERRTKVTGLYVDDAKRPGTALE
jgi:hypothetical protein